MGYGRWGYGRARYGGRAIAVLGEVPDPPPGNGEPTEPAAFVDLVHRYEANSLTGTINEGISVWPDLVSEHDLVQGTSQRRPTLRSGGGDRQIVRFDGTNQLLNVTAPAKAQPNTIIFVGVWAAAATPSGTAGFIFDGGLDGERHFWGHNLINHEMWAGTAGPVETRRAPRPFGVHTLIFDGADSLLRQDGVLRASGGDVGSQELAGLSVGARFNYTQMANGLVQAIYVWPRRLSEAELDEVEAWITEEHVPSALPGSLEMSGGKAEAPDNLGMTGNFTCEFWIKQLVPLTVNTGILGNTLDWDDFGWNVYARTEDEAGLSFNINGQFLRRGNLGYDEWHHIAISYDGLWMRGFIDGSFVGSVAPGNPLSGTAPFHIGPFNNLAGEQNFKIAEVRIWDSSLGTIGILERLFDQIDLDDLPAGLIHYWPLQTDTEDKVGGKHLTLTGDADLVAGGPHLAAGSGTPDPDPTSEVVEVFTESGTWIRPDGVDIVDVWIVAGGGSGGKTRNSSFGPGGGGAGGARLVEDLEVTDDVAVTVGEGGAAREGALEAGLDGGESSFGSESCVGGGGGASGSSVGGTGRVGGSGGGGSASNVGGAGTAGQGNDGGAGQTGTPYGGGGGGGKDATGANATGAGAGAGGAGVSGPDWVPEGTYAQGGTGGLWTGTADAHGDPGADGFGGGGGGIHYQGAASGPGGDGVVVVRYVDAGSGPGTASGTTIRDAVKSAYGDDPMPRGSWARRLTHHLTDGALGSRGSWERRAFEASESDVDVPGSWRAKLLAHLRRET